MNRVDLYGVTFGGRSAYRRSFHAIVIAFLVVAGTSSLSAQPAADRAWYERLVDGVAGFAYNIAWPTATYERVTFGSLRPVSGGADVTFRLHGKSAFAEGDLWLDVNMHVRSGEITGIEWGKNNGFFPPGLTTTTFLQALNEATKPPSQPPASAPAVAPTHVSTAMSVSCVSNPTKTTVSFNLQRGQNKAAFSLEAGKAMIFTAPASDRTFEVTFDNSSADGYQPGTLRFNAEIRSTKPESCTDDLTLVFVTAANRLGLTAVAWAPGFPSPFDGSVLQSDVKDKWVCAAGFKPYPWQSGPELQCVGNTVGVVGITLQKEANAPFLRIAAVFPGSPAALAGLVSGMTVVSIDAASTDGMEVGAAVGKLRGAIGEQFRLGVVAPGMNPTVVTLTRQ